MLKNLLKAAGAALHNTRLVTSVLVVLLGFVGSAFTPLAGDIAQLIDKAATAYETQAVKSDPQDAPTPTPALPAPSADPTPAPAADVVPLPDKPDVIDGTPS